MKAWTKINLGILAVLVGGTALALLGLWRIVSGGCGNEVLTEVPSPDERYRAVVFQRDCGATTGFSTHVSVLRGSRRLPNEAGNAFVADADRGQTSGGRDGRLFVAVRWRDNAHLDVRSDTRARIFLADSLVDGVQIRFLTSPRGRPQH